MSGLGLFEILIIAGIVILPCLAIIIVGAIIVAVVAIIRKNRGQ